MNERIEDLERYRVIFDHAPLGIFHFDPAGTIHACNEAFVRLIGSSQEALRDFNMLERVNHPEVLKVVRKALEGLAGFYEGPYRSVTGDRPATIRLRTYPLRTEHGDSLGGLGLVEDLTLSSCIEAGYRALVEQAADAILVGDTQGRIIDANSRATLLTGYPVTQLLGMHISQLFSAKTLEKRPLRFDRLDQGDSITVERLIQRVDGVAIPVEMNSIRLPDGRYQAILRDLSERVATERQLRETEKRYLDLFNNTPDNLFRVAVEPDGGFRVEDANPAQEAALGLAKDAIIGKHLEEFLPQPLAESILGFYRQCVARGEPLTYEESADLPQGRSWFQTLLVPIRNDQGIIRHLVGFSRDITQRKRTEAALEQASKLESLGVLAGGIAHDFNNLLTAVLGNINLAQIQLGEQSPAIPFLENAEKTVLRAAELTKQMLAYSGKGHFVVRPHDFNHVVEEMVHLLQVSISKRITLRFNLKANLPSVEADAAQIQQVVMNLVTNASDAIGDADGVIALSTDVQDLDEREIAHAMPSQHLRPGRYVVLEASDTGCGMAPEVLARIFDPFFSTKATGRGLGLSAMLGILRGHAAGIQISSQPGCGSTFQLFFPASTEPPHAPKDVAGPRAHLFSGLSLVVDDEEALRETAAAVLKTMGFEVLTARDGVEAVEMVQARPEAFRLVLLDLTMPRMDGRQAFQAPEWMGAKPSRPCDVCAQTSASFSPAATASRKPSRPSWAKASQASFRSPTRFMSSGGRWPRPWHRPQTVGAGEVTKKPLAFE